ncbi:MAG: hypothetical protein KME42_06510 [Tildeniella nuda ZEHNDER 1965/U140]|jgi:hypothetical protein|nr:hypothetical protein [Tildeniella nuda ZEHNDER 1965/U140]
MASEQHVREYLAYWFQLGKRLAVRGGEAFLQPRPVIQGDRYSQEFEDCWQQVRSAAAGDCYLEGTNQTIAELLSPAWEVDPCSRCAMPVPVKIQGVADLECPCIDLPGWPNTELPQPRSPISSQAVMEKVRDRLRKSDRQP